MSREAVRSDNPKGFREAQCPVCWRMFVSDSACEKHKRYKPTGTECLDPESLGLTPNERRGLIVWGYPSSDTNPWGRRDA